MTHREAQEIAVRLMMEHGLTQSGWQFRWSHSKRQFGSCQVRRHRNPWTGEVQEIKTIRLSKELVALNTDEEITDTILHEIAHAIAGVKNGHNRAWKEVCLKIGAKPRRLAGEEVKVVEPPYAIICGGCSRSVGRRHRRVSSGRLANFYCRACGPASKGKLRFVTAAILGVEATTI